MSVSIRIRPPEYPKRCNLIQHRCVSHRRKAAPATESKPNRNLNFDRNRDCSRCSGFWYNTLLLRVLWDLTVRLPVSICTEWILRAIRLTDQKIVVRKKHMQICHATIAKAKWACSTSLGHNTGTGPCIELRCQCLCVGAPGHRNKKRIYYWSKWKRRNYSRYDRYQKCCVRKLWDQLLNIYNCYIHTCRNHVSLSGVWVWVKESESESEKFLHKSLPSPWSGLGARRRSEENFWLWYTWLKGRLESKWNH